MATENLTKNRVDGFSFNHDGDKKANYLWDAKTPGLGVKATKTTKNYIFQARLDGTTIRLAIGSTKVYTVDDARIKAREYMALIDSGIDPRNIKKQNIATARKQELEQSPSSVAWDEYVKDCQDTWGERHRACILRLADPGGQALRMGRKTTDGKVKKPGHLFELLQVPLKELTPELIDAWAKKLNKHSPSYAKLALSIFSTFLNWCLDHTDYRKQVADGDLCRKARKRISKLPRRESCLQLGQLKAFLDSVEKHHNQHQAAYLIATLLTGARRGELATLKWCDVDIKWDTMTLRDKGTTRGENVGYRTIPLTPYLKMTINQLPRINPFVFYANDSKSGHVEEPKKTMTKVLEMADLPYMSIQGLRRTYMTLAEHAEPPAGVIAQITGHKASSVAEKHYKRRDIDTLRKWADRIEAVLIEHAGRAVPTPEQARHLKAV